jgi:CDGSH-type Zn-finger protein
MEQQKENKNGPSEKVQKIKVTKNGPYVVSGGVPIQKQVITVDFEGTPIKWRASTRYPSQEKCTLCRCGQSKNKPYCDGTHVKVGFDGTETAGSETYLNKHQDVDGSALKLIDIEELCASARFCHRAGGIWNLVPESDKKEKRRTAIEEACDCPSGRLVIWDKKAEKIIEPTFAKSLGLIEDPAVGVSGPIWVRGGVPVESADGKTYHIRNRITLCRCGKSKNKPFCDSSHYPEAEKVESVHNE